MSDGLMTLQDTEGNTVSIPAIGTGWHNLSGLPRVVVGYADDLVRGETLVVHIDLDTGQQFADKIEFFLITHKHSPPVRPTQNRASVVPGYVAEWLEENDYTLEKIASAFPPCAHCGESIYRSGHYMVTNELWDSVAQSDEYLHLWCLGERVGRPLGDADFTGAPINRLLQFARSMMIATTDGDSGI